MGDEEVVESPPATDTVAANDNEAVPETADAQDAGETEDEEGE